MSSLSTEDFREESLYRYSPCGMISPNMRIRAVELMTARTPPPRILSKKMGRVSFVLKPDQTE
jgi:hypothetical protein